MTLVLDAGAFVAVERGERGLAALLKAELAARRVPVTHGAVIGQVWRGGAGRQAPVARLLAATEVVAVDDALGRQAGLLLARTGLADVVDAALVLLASDDDLILTSDVRDLKVLAAASGTHVELVPV